MLFFNYSAPINIINAISLSLHSCCNKVQTYTVVQTCSDSKSTLFFLIIIILRPIWPCHFALSLQVGLINLAQWFLGIGISCYSFFSAILTVDLDLIRIS